MFSFRLSRIRRVFLEFFWVTGKQGYIDKVKKYRIADRKTE